MKNINKEKVLFLIGNLKTEKKPFTLLHFVPNVLSPGCSIEIKDLKEKYENVNFINLVIVSCSPDLDIDTWSKDNNIEWDIYRDQTRDLTKLFECLDLEYNVPTRYTALIDPSGGIIWEIDYPLTKNRDILLYNEKNNLLLKNV